MRATVAASGRAHNAGLVHVDGALACHCVALASRNRSSIPEIDLLHVLFIGGFMTYFEHLAYAGLLWIAGILFWAFYLFRWTSNCQTRSSP
jgi:hypothetical protein